MEREDYKKTLSRIENRNINKIVEFFQDLPYFSNYGKNSLQKIRFLFSRVKYKRKYIVFKEGDPSNHVYIVINGDFELVKKVKHIEEKEINYKNYIKSNIFNEDQMYVKAPKSEVDNKIAKFTKNKTLSNNNEYNQNYRIALLCKGQMFGDQDAFYEKPYQSTVICRSNDGELYRITRENFQKLKNIGDCWQKITSKYVTQEHLHYRLLKNQQKFNTAATAQKKRPKQITKNSTPYTLIAQKSPLLRQMMSKYVLPIFIESNKNKEIEKREIFKQIVKDYSKAEKQNFQSDYNDNNTITDADVQVYQQNYNLASFKQNKPVKRNLIRSKILSESRKYGNNNSSIMPSMTRSNYDNESMSFEVDETRGGLHINSKVQKMLDPGNMTNYNIGKFNKHMAIKSSPHAELRNSIEGSPARYPYQSVYSRESKNNLKVMGHDMKRQSLGVPSVNNLHSEVYRPGTQHDIDIRVRLALSKFID